jgi:F-type H+-transporting ATPase subunit alpha
MFLDKIEKSAPSIIERSSVNQSLETGYLVVDSLFPIGRGQRQLFIGDRKTGKTALSVDTVYNQFISGYNNFINLTENVFAVFISVGQKKVDVMNILLFFERVGILNTVNFVVASAADSAPAQFLAPFIGCSLAEFFRDSGLSSVTIYDDLSKHAVAYRQLSLLLRRPPGREAFPSDIFYLHARLLERAGRLATRYGNGSLTSFPIVETQAGDISAYIPTNIISITDGQIFFDSGLFKKGQRPAVNTDLSVSRIGSAAQLKSMKSVVGPFKVILAELKESQKFEGFGGDSDQVIREETLRGRVLKNLLIQSQYDVMPILFQTLLLFFCCTTIFKEVESVSNSEIFSASFFNIIKLFFFK